MPIALITGVTGQDGSYLAELLLSKGYKVHGLVRRSSHPNLGRIEGALNWGLNIHYGDLADGTELARLLGKVQPDEIYNLAAMSHVQVSFAQPVYTADITGTGCTRLLELIKGQSHVRYYQASSSEMFGSTPPPQNEQSPFHPRSPYGCSKVFAYWSVVNYREAFGLHASNGILFNHESPRRGELFVTRKIAKAVGEISRGERDRLELGNLNARRDWGYAGDYVEAMWRMLQQPEPDDYVIATGTAYSVAEFCESAFSAVGLDWRKYVVQSEEFMRPAEVDYLLGDARKAREKLGWTPSVTFPELVRRMVEAEL
jgi:GDPmannose 4,6-dehydratase